MPNTSSSAALSAVTVETEINELRSLVAGMKGKAADALNARIDALESRIAAAEPKDPGEVSRKQIIKLLSTVDNGKPGYLSMAEIETKLNLTKSAVHAHVNALEKRGAVWIRKTHDARNGRPCFYVYHPAAVRA